MTCPACGAARSSAGEPAEARFCAACGAPVLPAPAPEGDAAVAEYAELLRTLAPRLGEPWVEDELARAREELGVRRATHDRLVAAARPAPPPLEVAIDDTTLAELRAGELGLVRVRVASVAERPIVDLVVGVTLTGRAPLEAATAVPLGPGEDTALSVSLRPEFAGHHELVVTVRGRRLRGEEVRLRTAPLAVAVAAPAALQQNIHIDARAQRVGVFENIGGRERAGRIGPPAWRTVPVTAVEPERASPPLPAPAPAPSPIADLAAAIAQAAPGAKLRVDGRHVGPFVVKVPIELEGGELVATRGPVLLVQADVILRDVVIRGDAAPGAYAADAVEVRAGRVLLQRCTLSSDADGNLVPGRALAVTGRAEVELRGCTLERSGVGVAVDVSWSGFPAEGARGAKVRLAGGAIRDVGTGLAAAGADREVRAARVAFERVEIAAHAHPGSTMILEDCAPELRTRAEPGGTVRTGGSR